MRGLRDGPSTRPLEERRGTVTARPRYCRTFFGGYSVTPFCGLLLGAPSSSRRSSKLLVDKPRRLYRRCGPSPVEEGLIAGVARDLVVYEAGLWEANNTHAGANSAYRIVEGGGAASPNVLSELGAWTMRAPSGRWSTGVSRRPTTFPCCRRARRRWQETSARQGRRGVRHPGARRSNTWRACKHSRGGTLMDAWLNGLLSKTTSCLFPPFLARCPMSEAFSGG